tara:strand:- start:176 stop:826 length:651 start_codon:yes stop_codon:yes gene_type:complete
MKITNEDNMKLMARYEDNYFDLAITDPPYGIGEDGSKGVRTSPKRPNSYKRKPKYKAKGWDKKPPNKEYFLELLRVSKNVIIFGANHFIEKIPNANSSCWIVWDKKNEGTDFADCELAWSNMKTTVRKYRIHKFDATRGGKDCIHPTQKPVKLYEWLLIKYAKEGDKILDTHLGSGSIAIACHNLGYDLTACELDKEYYNAAMKRINNHTAQLRIC